jgi:two-component system chemotaxis sensor kinase CheA
MLIRSRITLLIVLSFVGISVVGGYTLYLSWADNAEVASVTEQVVPSVLASADLVSRVKDVYLATINLVDSPGRAVDAQSMERLQRQKEGLAAALDQQARQATSQRQRGLVTEAQENLKEYFDAIDQTARLRTQGQGDLARVSLVGSVAQYQTAMEQIVETLRVEKDRSKDVAIRALEDNLAYAVSATALITAIAILVLSGFGLMLYRQVTRPLSRMKEEMSEIANSQDFTRRVPVHRHDEIGQSIVAFNRMIEQIQNSSALLRHKTNDLQAMLQNMPQGVLTISSGNRVHPEYSAYLELILETRDIAGRDLMDLLFSGTGLGAAELSQVEAAIGACIGDDAMNFEFNQHLLVGRIERQMPDGCVKILDLNWSPITDESGMIEQLLLCIRDVTELRKLAAQASEQKRELEIIGELLALIPEKFAGFVADATRFIDENEALIRKSSEGAGEVVAQLFRNMHTIKGNARTYGLQHLIPVLHETEQAYADLSRPHAGVVWDGAGLLGQLARVRQAIEHYAHISDDRLRRRTARHDHSVERFLMVDREMIQHVLQRLEHVNTDNIHDLVAARDAVRKALRLLGTEPLREILAGVLDGLPSLAEELGKRPPQIEMVDKAYRIRSQAAGMLRNVFTHLLRNALDHGLETAEARLAQDKPPAGRIWLQVAVSEGMLAIRLRDDGRGLALARIRAIALARGLLDAGRCASDLDVAQQILLPGFSTAERVTAVSGRGVGMDAVQSFVRAEGGRIALHFLDRAEGADYRAFETVVLLPMALAERAEGALRAETGAEPPPAIAKGRTEDRLASATS